MLLQLSAKTEYGLMLLKYLAKLPSDRVVSLGQVAQDYKLPIKYLEQVARDLVKAKLISSRPGKRGGYSLLINPAQTPLAAVLKVLEGPLEPVICKHDGTCCKRQTACPNKTGWLKVQRDLLKTIGRYKLASLINY